jgi:hypothetical protein
MISILFPQGGIPRMTIMPDTNIIISAALFPNGKAALNEDFH